MNDTKLLIGSLSNDLYRVANLIQRGSFSGARRFLQESQRWTDELENHQVKEYIQKVLTGFKHDKKELTIEFAEKCLMYSIILQNYALHFDD